MTTAGADAEADAEADADADRPTPYAADALTTHAPFSASRYKLFRQWLPTLMIGVLPPATEALAMYDEQFTWKPLLSRLEGCDDAKLLTMLRMDVSVSHHSDH